MIWHTLRGAIYGVAAGGVAALNLLVRSGTALRCRAHAPNGGSGGGRRSGNFVAGDLDCGRVLEVGGGMGGQV